MGLSHLLCLLLCAAALTVSDVSCKDELSEEYRWIRQSLPVLQETHAELVDPPSSSVQEEHKDEGVKKNPYGTECQNSRPTRGKTEQERILGYETMYENGTRMHTDVRLQGFNKTCEASFAPRTRRKRQVFGPDGRFVISDSHFTTNYPFSTAVRLSTGCSGVLVSPKHVLTAAHCLHDGRGYLQSARNVRVGVLQLKSKRRRGGRRRGGPWKAGRRREEGEVKEQKVEEGEEHNSIDGDVVGRRRRGKGRRRRGRRGGEEGLDHRGPTGGSDRRRAGKSKGLGRIRRAAEPNKQPVFQWARVRQTQIPEGWIRTEGSTKSSDYDYALLELKRPTKQKYMELGVAPSATPLTRIHFSGYDVDKNLLGKEEPGKEKVVYRFCSVRDESEDLLYQHCDAQPGAAGAGVYIRLWQEAGGAVRRGKWQRRVIGVFTGHQWVEEVEGGGQRDFNVAVRITPLKYAQICHWIHGDPNLCKEV